MSTAINPVAQTVVELDSLVDNLLLLLSEKEKMVVKKRFNLDGSHKNTLQEIGEEFSVTRERVRQIEKNALTKMRRNVFNTSLRNLHDFVSKVVRDHGGLLREDILQSTLKEQLPASYKYDENNVHLSLVLHENLDCVGNTITFHPYLKEKNITDYSLKHASNLLVNDLQKSGEVRKIEELHNGLKTVFDLAKFDLTSAKSLIEIDKRLTVLDENLIGLMEWRHIRPRTLKDKILFVLRNEKKPLHFTYIVESITKANFDNKSVNLQAVHNELIRHNEFILIGRGIYALKEWGYENGTVSEVIENILKEKSEMDQEEIVKAVLERRQVKRITIILALKNSSKFERVGRKVYKFKG